MRILEFILKARRNRVQTFKIILKFGAKFISILFWFNDSSPTKLYLHHKHLTLFKLKIYNIYFLI